MERERERERDATHTHIYKERGKKTRKRERDTVYNPFLSPFVFFVDRRLTKKLQPEQEREGREKR
jgi:hypothetical protein